MAFSTLSIGASALTAAQRAVDVAANNVANANNESYTRQRLTITNAYPTPGTAGLRGDGDRGSGVTVIEVARLRDRLADVSYRSEAAVSGAATARSDTLSRTAEVLGTYGNGLPEELSAFTAAWDQLSMTPQDSAARASVLTTGQQLVDSINGAASKLDDVAHEVSLRVGDDVNELNGLLTNVASLNDAIVRAQSEQRSPNDLLDQRDAALDRIAALTGAKMDPQLNGAVNVSIGGVSLVNGITASPVALTTGPPMTLTVGGAPVTATGEIGGYTATANVDLPAYRSQLDAIAQHLRDVVNTAHRAGTGLDGSTGLDFFSGTDAASFAVNPSLTPDQIAASAGGQVADGNGALAVATALRTSTAAGGSVISDQVNALGTRIGQAANDAARNASTNAASLGAAQTARASTNGVSVDEEMVDMLKFQHTYEAAARFISVADGMLDTLINGMVR
jgi:flagellar hook-associated protein 1 FlgK